MEWRMSALFHLPDSTWLKRFFCEVLRASILQLRWRVRHSSLKRVAVFYQKWQSLSYHEMAFSPMFGVNTQRLLVCGESQIHSALCHPFYKACQVWNKKPKRKGCIRGSCQGVRWPIIVQKV